MAEKSVRRSTDNTHTFPATDGTIGQVLTTNGAGTFSWASGAAVSGAAESLVN